MVDHSNFVFTISPEYNDTATIIHEIIHVYEYVYSMMPSFYHDALVISLYNYLRDQITELNNLIETHAHTLSGEEVFRAGGDHDILFYLKSLDLDLKLGYKLGTVCGYGRDEFEENPIDE